MCKQSRMRVYALAFVLSLVASAMAYGWLGIDVCPLHRWTGWPCPACGIPRSMLALARGEVLAAFRINPLWSLALPLAMVVILSSSLRRRAMARFSFAPGWVWLLVALLAILLNWIYLIAREASSREAGNRSHHRLGAACCWRADGEAV